jgi:hypothetical protein
MALLSPIAEAAATVTRSGRTGFCCNALTIMGEGGWDGHDCRDNLVAVCQQLGDLPEEYQWLPRTLRPILDSQTTEGVQRALIQLVPASTRPYLTGRTASARFVDTLWPSSFPPVRKEMLLRRGDGLRKERKLRR